MTATPEVKKQWNRSPAQAGCVRQALRTGALGRPRGIGWRGRRERGSGWGTHVTPWLIMSMYDKTHCNVVKVISLQLIKINGKKKKKQWNNTCQGFMLSYNLCLAKQYQSKARTFSDTSDQKMSSITSLESVFLKKCQEARE